MPRISFSKLWRTVSGAILGALLGSKLLYWVQYRSALAQQPMPVWLGGKTIVGGGVACSQFSGLQDLTYGEPTTAPWGWNYGDGVARHPTAFYEVVGLAAIYWLLRCHRFVNVPGDQFRAFMVCYFTARLGLDGLKPPHGASADRMLMPNLYGPLSAIQWACVLGILYYRSSIMRWANARTPIVNA